MRHAANLKPAADVRFAVVDFDITFFREPLNWRLRIYGPSVGGYGTLNGAVNRYGNAALAQLAADVWLATGVIPAHQTDAQRAAVEAVS